MTVNDQLDPFGPFKTVDSTGRQVIISGHKVHDEEAVRIWVILMTEGRLAVIDRSDYATYECQECGGEIRGVISAVRIGPVPEVERGEKPAAGRAIATGPKPPSRAAVRRRLREAEAQVKALRIQLAQLDEGADRAGLGQHLKGDAE